MSSCYLYSITGSFPSASIATTKFHDEVETNITGSVFYYVNVYGDVVNVCFSSSLDVSGKLDLDNVVASHNGIPYYDWGYNYEDLLDLSGSRPMVGDLLMTNNEIVSASMVNGVVVESHSLRHLYTGSDELNGDQIGIDFSPSYYIPNSSILEAGSIKHLSAHLAGIDQCLSSSYVSSSIFGKDNYFIESNVPFSTTYDDFLTAVTLNFTSSFNGNYRVGWNYVWSYNSVLFDIEVRVRLDDNIDLLLPHHVQEPSDVGGFGLGGTDQRYQNSSFKYVYLTSGSHSIDIDVKSTKKGKDATIHFASIECWRVN